VQIRELKVTKGLKERRVHKVLKVQIQVLKVLKELKER